MNTAFEKAKIRRTLINFGSVFTFVRPKLNEFGEPVKGEEKQICIVGVYHEASGGYTSKKVSEGSVTRTRLQPMILTSWENFQTVEGLTYEGAQALKYGDVLTLEDKKMKITEVKNVKSGCFAGEISLEVCDEF